jgi:ribosomal protein S24E
MSLKILEEKHNLLFNRKEIKATISSEITPSRAHILELLSKKFSTPIENIKIKGIRGNFGTGDFSIGANIYHSVKEKNLLEVKKKKETEKGVAV